MVDEDGALQDVVALNGVGLKALLFEKLHMRSKPSSPATCPLATLIQHHVPAKLLGAPDGNLVNEEGAHAVVWVVDHVDIEHVAVLLGNMICNCNLALIMMHELTEQRLGAFLSPLPLRWFLGHAGP